MSYESLAEELYALADTKRVFCILPAWHDVDPVIAAVDALEVGAKVRRTRGMQRAEFRGGGIVFATPRTVARELRGRRTDYIVIADDALQGEQRLEVELISRIVRAELIVIDQATATSQ